MFETLELTYKLSGINSDGSGKIAQDQQTIGHIITINEQLTNYMLNNFSLFIGVKLIDSMTPQNNAQIISQFTLEYNTDSLGRTMNAKRIEADLAFMTRQQNNRNSSKAEIKFNWTELQELKNGKIVRNKLIWGIYNNEPILTSLHR